MSWNRLPTGPLGAAANLPGIDAQLVWADASGWRDFLRPGQKALERIPVIVEIEPAGADALAALVRNPGSIPPVYRSDGTMHCTARLTVADCRRLLRAWAKGGPVRRLELQAPLIPQRPRVPAERKGVEPAAATTEKTQGSLLIGVIDYGCPFAHRHLRDATNRGTRILNLWLQDETHSARTVQLGTTPSDFGYGLVLSRSMLNSLMDRHTADGFVDEEACYAEAGMNELRQRFLHGGAVLDLFVGPRPLSARTSDDPDRSPTWDTASDEVGQADIAFVQLPGDLVQDSTSAGLARCLLDGVKYILSCAGSETTRIVVNISDGSSRGSHDGNSIIERAMSSLVTEKAERGRQVVLVLPAGNSRDEERHAQFDKLPPREWRSLRLRLPPGCEAPSQLVIRVPTAITDFEVRVVPPGQGYNRQMGGTVRWGEAKAWPDNDQPACAVILPASGTMETTSALVTWAPTERFGDAGVRAPAGVWEIAVRSRSGSSEAVHFYIARNQTNPHALCRGRQAFFLDEGGYDPNRHLRARDGDPNPPQSPIRRRGSLNSLATSPSGKGMVVVGSTFLRERARTAYSSEGPAAGGEPVRSGPDTCAPTDMSRALRGIAAAGTMNGQVVRVTGTSFAAPQVARALANDQWASWLVHVRSGKTRAAKRTRSRRVDS